MCASVFVAELTVCVLVVWIACGTAAWRAVSKAVSGHDMITPANIEELIVNFLGVTVLNYSSLILRHTEALYVKLMKAILAIQQVIELGTKGNIDAPALSIQRCLRTVAVSTTESSS